MNTDEEPLSKAPEPEGSAQAEKRTYVFIDESGDPGFKLARGSSTIFCLAAVVFQNSESMDATEAVIQAHKHGLSLPKSHEFHFNKESEERRKGFCQAVCGSDFSVRAIVIDKNHIYEESILRRAPNHFYNFFTKMLLQHSFGSIENARVYIDGNMKRELRTYLRQQLNLPDQKIIHKTEFRDSAASPLIQLADMVTGSIARAHRTDDKNTQEYVKILRPRIENIWVFGKEKKAQD